MDFLTFIPGRALCLPTIARVTRVHVAAAWTRDMGLHDAWAKVREWAHNHMDPRKRVATRIVVSHIHMWAVMA